MSTRLIQVVAFANVAPAATVALPHNININGTQKKPDFVAADTSGFTIVVSATDVSVTNTGTDPASINVWLELKHSIPRELGALPNLTPQPFIAAAGGGGGGGGGSDSQPLIMENRSFFQVPVSEDLPIFVAPLATFPDAEVFVIDLRISFNCDADGSGRVRLQIDLQNSMGSLGLPQDRVWIQTDPGATVQPTYSGRWIVPVANLGTLTPHVAMDFGAFCEVYHCSISAVPTLLSRATITT